MIRDADIEMTVMMEVYVHRHQGTGGTTPHRATWGAQWGAPLKEGEQRESVGKSLYVTFRMKEWVRHRVTSLSAE